MHLSNNFHVLILAPDGLEGVDAYLGECLLPLEAWRSGFSGKVVLRRAANECNWLDFAMDGSLTHEMNASGEIRLPTVMAIQLLDSLSLALQRAGFPHWIGLDCAKTQRTMSIQFQYPWVAQVP